MMQLRCVKLIEDARLPEYGSSGAAALDFFVAGRGPWTLYPGAALVLHTGIAVEVPEDHVLLLFSRSGHGFKQDIRLSNCVGVIDSDYRGEVLVKLACDDMASCDEPPLVIYPGERIAQGIVLPRPRVECVEVDGLTGTTRGLAGFGSTGR
jgi:dUTP pyrophosphatase